MAPGGAACPVREAARFPYMTAGYNDRGEPMGDEYVTIRKKYLDRLQEALAQPCGTPQPSEAVAHWAGITVGCAAIPSEPGRETWDALTVAAARFILQFVRDAGAPGGGPQEER
jgi:hypothetical protein